VTRLSVLGPLRTFTCVPTFRSGLRNVGRGFGPAADSLSLLVQRKEAKKAPSIRHTFCAVVTDRCAPAVGGSALAKPRSTDWPGKRRATPAPTCCRTPWRGRPGARSPKRPPWPATPRRALRRRSQARTALPRDSMTVDRTATVWPGQSVERGFARSCAAAAGAQRSMTTALKVRRIEGAFFASFLCARKERESAAGPKPRPTSSTAPRKAETAQDVANVRNGPQAVATHRPEPR